jgi:hypothetical protein
MRIRTIKPEFFNHEGIFDAEHETNLPLRLAFIGLWCAADREGRFRWEPRRLKTQIMPYDDCDFSRVLDALMTRGFIVKYASTTGEFGVIPTFSKHQVINNRERHSELPDPCNCNEIDACLTREPRVNHAGKAEGKGNGMEKEMNREGETREESPPPHDFEKSSEPESTDQIIKRINAVRPMWSKAPHLTSQEQHDLFTAIDGIRQITEEQWASLASWAASPDGKDDWTIKTRSRFIANYSEALMKAGDWSAGELKPQPHLDLGGRRAASRMTFES